MAFVELEREQLDEARNGGAGGIGGAGASGIRETRVGNTIRRSAEGPAAFDLLASLAEPDPASPPQPTAGEVSPSAATEGS